MIDSIDFDRIRGALDRATPILKSLQPPENTRPSIEPWILFAAFEALSCEAFLADNDNLRDHFDDFFATLNGLRPLTLSHYVPAMIDFLFDERQDRQVWARKCWTKIRKTLTADMFDFAVRDSLARVLKGATMDPQFIQKFWSGMNLIAEKLSSELITHSLRALEIDVYKLALDHLHQDSEGLRYLLRTVDLLLTKGPRDFWEAMGTISPTAFVEYVFNSPHYTIFIQQARVDENYETSALKDMVSWVSPFISSLRMTHKPEACRAFTSQLLEKYQRHRYPSNARIECFHIGLAVLSKSLTDCSENGDANSSVDRIAATSILNLTKKYVLEVLSILDLPEMDVKWIELEGSCSLLLRNALQLECISLRKDRVVLQQEDSPPPTFVVTTPRIWKDVLERMKAGNTYLARTVLFALPELTGVDNFESKRANVHTKERNDFDSVLESLHGVIRNILELVNDFSPRDLNRLFEMPEVAEALIKSLFASDQGIYEAGINLIKTLSGESMREEAIRHVLRQHFDTVLTGVSWSLRRIAERHAYGPCPRMLKTCTDIVDILCDSQDGLLRNKDTNISPLTVRIFWNHLWHSLRIIYDCTQDWNKDVKSAVMVNFCRDVMQFSEHLIDQFTVFDNFLRPEPAAANNIAHGNARNGTEDASAVAGDAAENTSSIELLSHPSRTMETMSRYLRLRDEYLLTTSANLIRKLLGQLTSKGMTLNDKTSSYLEQVAESSVNSNLTSAQKAEIWRALSENLGRELESDDEADIRRPFSGDLQNDDFKMPPPKKKLQQGTIDFETWKHKDTDKAHREDDDDNLDDNLASLTPTAAIYKAMKASQPVPLATTPRVATKPKSSALPLSSMKKPLPSAQSAHQKQIDQTQSAHQKQIDQAAFLKKREQAKLEKKKRDAEAISKAKKHKLPNSIAGQTANEGSILAGIGVKGKTHGPKGESVMVSSESESETDSDNDWDRTIFGVSSAPKPKPKLAAVYTSRLLQGHGPVKKIRQVRAKKDMRARVAPDLSPLHKDMLAWDFFSVGDFPPGSHSNHYQLVSQKFRTPVDYKNTFKPLLLLEAWQSFCQIREEGGFKSFKIDISNRMSVDALVEISSTMTLADFKDVGIYEADIVLMSRSTTPASDKEQPHCLARVHRTAKKKSIMEITWRVTQGNPLSKWLTPNSAVYGSKISSIVPLEREYGALLGLEYYDLCDEIINARVSPKFPRPEATINALVTNYKVNQAQAKAVQSAVDNDAFTLIQGPPGSGKTKTIVAIVGALLTRTLNEPKEQLIARPLGPNSAPPSAVTAKKLLVCAPSNAAVDELVMRFMAGVKTLNGAFHKINVIRLGRSESINPKVLEVTLDELVKKRIGGQPDEKKEEQDDIGQVKQKHKAVSDELLAYREELEAVKAKGEKTSSDQFHKLETLKRRKQQLGNRIDQLKDSGNTNARDAEIKRRHVQQAIIDEAHILCATLSGSGHDMFRNLKIDFETVVIDEAAQSIELSALIPLKYGCAKCIMVGDPKQLPPTVLSREAARFQYEQSLFVRMQANHPEHVHLLDTQYRMHPDISRFPSKTFYDGLLLDGPDMASLRTKPWHSDRLLAPYRFFDVQGQSQSAPKGHSLINLAELEVAIQLYRRLKNGSQSFDFTGKIGIITPYKSQLAKLKERFTSEYGEKIFKTIEFNTTDAFQGRESEVIIFSCVRASTKGIGFLSDIRRMNVGITRAKSSLWVLGNSASLMQGEYWSKLIEDAKSRDRYTNGDVMKLLKAPGPAHAIPIRDVKMVNGPESPSGGRLLAIETGSSGRSLAIDTASSADAKEIGGAESTAPRIHGAEKVKSSTSTHSPRPDVTRGAASDPRVQMKQEGDKRKAEDDLSPGLPPKAAKTDRSDSPGYVSSPRKILKR